MASSTLATRIGRENNLNAVRLFLSLLVLFVHSFQMALGLDKMGSFSLVGGNTAVNLFFFISGMLITASWLRSKNMNDYLRKRIFRIYPGFIAALLFSTAAMIIANPRELFKPANSWHGLKVLIEGCFTLSSDCLTGSAVFPQNPYPNTANGSLWTIPAEFQCYLLICVIGLFCLLKYRWLILALFIYSYLLLCKGLWLGWDVSHMDRRFLTFFSAGMCTWLWRDKIPYHWSIALFSLLLFMATAITKMPLPYVEPFVLTYLALWAGYAKPLSMTRWCDTTDLSYGVYLYAFPIQQLIATRTYMRDPWLMFLAAVPLSLLAAFASWHLVEKRFLRMKASRFMDRDPAAPVPTGAVTKPAQLEQAF